MVIYKRQVTGPDHLDIDAKFKLRKEILEDQIEAVINYAHTPICRSIQLLGYFNEVNASKCGVCDVCITEKKNDNLASMTEIIDFELITLLQSGPLGIVDLVSHIKAGHEQDRIERIRELLDAGKIKTDGSTYYL